MLHVAVSCGKPGLPEHGVKYGSVYTYPSRISFKCIPGHFLVGSDKIQCLATGKWSQPIPECNGM